MNERKVTIDRQTYDLGREFMVVATQNPIEQQGTYPLPEAQLDRFLFKIVIDYPQRDEELQAVRLHGRRVDMPSLTDFGLTQRLTSEHVLWARQACASVTLSEELTAYIVDLIRATRRDQSIEVGASTRAANMLASASRAQAALSGRDFVIPDDVKFLAAPTLRHRLVMTPAADMDGITPDRAVETLLAQIPAPR
jgi:MoxR-like ATPase